ncbi:glycoside hydrolase family 3 N-terminal domain-containing protein [Jannaschia formosa]|uniref:glycoside hydrolase family 3 N-terminal domain-containing protein n=1 Tax=Jannaschia formosa TaxID=2259592 RepID=UPI000E1C1559|nr:glycoside hydrolase family 3 N-terminal domain-containing protein [Jannaschia formosa]TFL19624.1 glycoside hydrolase family 3 protein [Jannaschia formosa]
MAGAGPGAFILGCEGPDLGPSEAAFFREADPWGFILFARNVDGPDRLRALTGALRDSVGRHAPVLIDQEGGRVQRLGPPFWSDWPAPLDQMDRASDPARAMFLRATLIARELRDVGVDVNCTPTADIAGEATHPFLYNRLYGRDVEEVVTRARANAEGCLQGGVLPVLKHMPGHGRGTADSHLRLPVVDTPRAELRETDFEVFRRLADLPLGMTAHVVYSDIDPLPGTISPAIHALVRGELGFGGLLMTDDISMQALPGDMATRCAASIAAGCDLVLHCNGDRAEMERVAGTCPRLAGAALERADRALAMRAEPVELDIEAARAELRALTS